MRYHYYCKQCGWEDTYDDAAAGAQAGDEHVAEHPTHQTAMEPTP